MFTSTSGGVDPRGIVDRIGVQAHPAPRRLDAAALRHAEIGALTHHFRVQFGAGDAHGVVGAVAGVGVGFGAGANIGADAAEEQQVHRRLEDRVDDFDRRRGRAF